MATRKKSNLIQTLACVLGATCLAASSVRADSPTQTIGYDPIVPEHVPGAIKGGIDLELNPYPLYIPFVFDFGGGQYSLDSVQLALFWPGAGAPPDASDLSLSVTSILGTDLTTPPSLATFSAIGGISTTTTVYTFHAAEPSLLTSGSTYYLHMTLAVGLQVQWVSTLWTSGTGPADGDGPDPKGNGPGGGGHPGDPDSGVTLTPLGALNPSGGLTYRIFDPYSGNYADRSGVYGIALTASIVPEPTSFTLVLIGLTLGAALLFRPRRRR